MNTDSLLALLLNVAIPTALAIAGAVLTIQSLPSRPVRHWSWLCTFLALGVAALVLGWVQQVRLTTRDNAIEQKTREERERLVETERYTQGQLDSFTKVLKSVVDARGEPDVSKSALRGLLSAITRPAPVPKTASSSRAVTTAVSGLSNRELRYKARALVGGVRTIEHNYAVTLEDPGRGIGSGAYEAAYAQQRDAWESIRVDALLTRDELLKRLPASAATFPNAEAKSTVEEALTEGSIAGVHPLLKVAAYLERLALALPD